MEYKKAQSLRLELQKMLEIGKIEKWTEWRPKKEGKRDQESCKIYKKSLNRKSN